MKTIFTYAFLLFSAVAGFAQNRAVDTTQHIVPNRKNAEATLSKPYLIVISADGFRYDFAKKYNAKNLLKLAEEGVQAEAMIPAYPSITGPNHYTLMTGMYPSHTGFVDNWFYDFKRDDYFAMSHQNKISDGSWLGGVPLWSLAERQGVLSAPLFWVAANSDAGGTRPTYYYNYHEQFGIDQKIKIVTDWLQLPEDVRPHFITFYFPEVDKMGHLFGPETPETEQAVRFVDESVGKLMDAVDKLGLPDVNYIFVSDHGMLRVDIENPLEIPEILLDKERFLYINSQSLLRVHVKNPKEIKQVFRQLKKEKTDDYDVFLTKRFPRKLHYAARDDRFNRIGEILLVPKAPKIFLEKNSKVTPGKHGYDPAEVPEMLAVFYAKGPAFRNGITVPPFENVNLYPILAKILGLEYSHTIDGNSKTAREVLVD
ncbi:MAG: ectonucleotide pyrophosphatase/phosphodiesterase [Capnocytophaga sp.]|nr:ectonucleotide pyrophosphatase/phosphodiesterase [Capnocytophaga sp.]